MATLSEQIQETENMKNRQKQAKNRRYRSKFKKAWAAQKAKHAELIKAGEEE